MKVPGLPVEPEISSRHQQGVETLLVVTREKISTSKTDFTLVPSWHCPCLCAFSHTLTGTHPPVSTPPAWDRSLHHEPLSCLCLLGDRGAVCRLSIWVGMDGRRLSQIASHQSCSMSAWWPYLWCGLGVVTTPPSTCQFLAVICCLSWISWLFSASWFAALAPIS